MIKGLFNISLLLVSLGFSKIYANGGVFEIKGHLDGLADGEKVILGDRFKDWHYLTHIDSCKVEGGNFHLRGIIVEGGPRQFELLFYGHRTGKKDGQGNIGGITCTIWADNGDNMTISGGDINKMENFDFASEVEIEGSRSTFAMDALTPLVSNYLKCYDDIERKFKAIGDSIGFDRDLIAGEGDVKNILDDGLGNTLLDAAPIYQRGIPAAICKLSDLLDGHCHSWFVHEVWSKLDSDLRTSYYGKLLSQIGKLSIGQPFPDFKLVSDQGKEVEFNTFVKTNKLTIVHFWASNSFERERYQTQLNMFFNKYKEKGLGVIAVSADTSADDWKFMIHQKKYPWINVSDLRGWGIGSMINDVYLEGGHTIPNTTNVLVDGQGKIIAWDPQGVEIQWYLWKYLGD